jgi:hypothetical protein
MAAAAASAISTESRKRGAIIGAIVADAAAQVSFGRNTIDFSGLNCIPQKLGQMHTSREAWIYVNGSARHGSECDVPA